MTTLDKTAVDNIPLRFLATLAKYPDTEVLRWKNDAGDWESWTTQRLADETARLVTALAGLGVGAGDRVVLMLLNRAEFHALDLATLFLGATPISIYNSSAPEQIEYLVGHCGAKVAVVENVAFHERFAQVRGALPTLEHLAVIDDPEGVTGALSYADLAASEPADLAPLAENAKPEDLATVIYTSGTTGPPKGVMLTHSNVTFTLAAMEQQLEGQTDIGESAGKRYISYLPMAHIFERLLGHYYMINLATQVICCPDTSKIAAYAAETSPHILIGVPRVWEKIYAGVNAALSGDPEKAGPFNEAVEAALPIMEKMTRGEATDEEIETWNFLDAVAFSQVRPLVGLNETKIAISGAAPLPPEIMAWFRAIGVPLTEGYGLSETTAALTWAAAVKPGYVGFAAEGVELMLGEDGEVLTRGPHVFPGYLNDPEKTAEAIDEEGWFHTGDIGELDDDGYLKIIDRKKELIITAGGKNISPANLEGSLKMIPLVGQACAIGDQKPFVAALVVLDPDAAAAWAAKHGLTGDDASLASLANNPDVIAEIDAGLAEAMSKYNNAESVKKVKVLADEWMPDSELLTPTSKLKRRGVMSIFAKEIDALYAK